LDRLNSLRIVSGYSEINLTAHLPDYEQPPDQPVFHKPR
jgi:hypothetical protein